MTFAAGETIYRMGEASNQAYLVLAGEAATERGGTRVINGKGALLGFSGLFNRPYGATATAVGECSLLVFSRRELRALIRSNPEESVQIIEAMLDMVGRVAAELERQAGS